MKHALVTGVTGQDGSCLAELVLDQGCNFRRIICRAGTLDTSRIDYLHSTPHLNQRLIFILSIRRTEQFYEI